MKTRRGSKQRVKARPVIAWLIAIVLVGLELWTACGWYGGQAGRGPGQSADPNSTTLTAPFLLW